MKTNILITGGTGYVGGSVLSRFLAHPNRSAFTLTALVRSTDKANALRQLLDLPEDKSLSRTQINVVQGSTDDVELVATLAASADVVLSITNDDDEKSIQAILSGLKRRYQKTGRVPTLIHTSSTGVIADRAEGEYASEHLFSDLDVERIWSLTSESGAQHQHVNLPIVEADARGYIRSYFICPSVVFGDPSTALYSGGVQNGHIISGMLRDIAAECGGARVVGAGKNICGMVANSDVAELFVLLYDAINRGQELGHGRSGIYFANADEFDWMEYETLIGEELVRRGQASRSTPEAYTREELETHFPPAYVATLGSNVRARAERAKAIGWVPKANKAALLDMIRRSLEC